MGYVIEIIKRIQTVPSKKKSNQLHRQVNQAAEQV